METISIRTLAIILFSAFGVLLLIASFVVTYIIAKRRVKNDPNNAVIVIKNGHEGEPFKANLVNIVSRGFRYRYKYKKRIFHVILPRKYDPFYIRNRLWIFVDNVGDVVSSPFNGKNVLTEDEKSELILEILQSHIAADAVRSIKGGNGVNVILIGIVIAAIVILGLFGFNYYQNSLSANQPTQQQTQQPVEVK